MIALVVITWTLAVFAAFLLGRRSSLKQVEYLRADRDTWRELSDELHEENCKLRKAAL